ncbi:MAG: hypothetical protein HQ541_12575 [Mariniphaga sp.]|nr:hypothetical protein [Mariniphaga sp.]
MGSTTPDYLAGKTDSEGEKGVVNNNHLLRQLADTPPYREEKIRGKIILLIHNNINAQKFPLLKEGYPNAYGDGVVFIQIKEIPDYFLTLK